LKRRVIKKILIWTASVLIVAAIGWYYTMDYAINKMLRTISLDDMSAVGEETVVSEIVDSQSPTPDKNSPNPIISASPSASANPSDSTNPNPTSLEKTPTPTPKYVGTITKDKAEKAQENITLKEKTDITMILLKKLSPGDISLFTKMASGGLNIGLSQGKNYQDSLKEIPNN
jgi:hypothetical protein